MYKNQLCTMIPLSQEQEQEQNAKLQLLLVILLLLVFSACLLLLLFVCCNHNMRGYYNINSQLYCSTSINKDKNFMEDKEEPQHQPPTIIYIGTHGYYYCY